jgi:VWFA-related protein
MPSLRALLCTLTLAVFASSSLIAQGTQPAPSTIPTIQVTSRLVFLDVTVLDKRGNPVVTGLTKDDFTITESKKPQRIFSFEAPEVHTIAADAGDDNPDGNAPATIMVLDLLNSPFEDFAYIRYSVRKYLEAQPAQLRSPTEMMVVGNNSLEMVQSYTRDREDLLFALDHLPGILPYKFMNGSFVTERFNQSIDALQEIALQNQGISGRKNVIWVGHGGPNIFTVSLPYPWKLMIDKFVHETTNMMVDARISLFVVYPGLKAYTERDFSLSALDANVDIGNNDPFAGDVNFGVFVDATGGKLFYNRNDVDAEISRSQLLGSQYYTLTYRPSDGNHDGKFRRIRVTLRDPNLRVFTKAGYFAPDKGAPPNPRQQMLVDISQAARSSIAFRALDLKIDHVVRHPDARTAELTMTLNCGNLAWQTVDGGKSRANITLAAVSLSKDKNILSYRVEHLGLLRPTENGAGREIAQLKVTVPVPRKARSVRVVVEGEGSGRIGGADLERKAIDAAPEAPTPDSQLIHRPPDQTPR